MLEIKMSLSDYRPVSFANVTWLLGNDTTAAMASSEVREEKRKRRTLVLRP